MFATTRRLMLALLLAAAICPYFIDLDSSSIWDANEAFYVETPREMMERGDYISPTFNYEPRFNKPVLSYWIVAAFYHLFGVSVAVQRFPIAIGAVILILVTLLLAREAELIPGRARPGASDAQLWAALLLATAPRLLMFARRIFIDIYISMFMAATLLFFALSERRPDRRRVFLSLMYVSVGLGVLTKGPVAALLPGLVFVVYLAVHRELHRARSMMLPAGLVLVLVIVVPYYVAQYQRHGWTYIVSFFVGENLGRYTEGFGVEPARRIWFYLPVLFSDSFPASLFLLPAAVLWLRDRRTLSHSDPSFRIRTLLWLWIVMIIGFFSLSAAKQDLYIFPIVPAVAALAGGAIGRGLSGDTAWPLSLRPIACAAGVLLVLIGAGLLHLFHTAGAVYSLGGAMAIGVTGILGGTLSFGLAVRRALRLALIAVVSTTVLLNWIFILRTLPSFEAYKPVPAFAEVIHERLRPGDVVATFNVALPSMVFYLRRHVEELGRPSQLFDVLSSRRAYVTLSSADYEALRDEAPAATCVLDRRPTFDVKLKNIISREPLPELVLVTNHCE
jgi:4-amino-4-deoxy-L-arabinose transferase-like glycosyltransferase